MKKVLTMIISVALVLTSLFCTMIYANANTEINTETITDITKNTTESTTTINEPIVPAPTTAEKITEKATSVTTSTKAPVTTAKVTTTKKNTTASTTAFTGKLRKLKAPKNIKIKVKYVKTPCGGFYEMVPHTIISFKPVKGATAYRIKYTYAAYKYSDKWTKLSKKVKKKNAKTLIIKTNYFDLDDGIINDNCPVKYEFKIQALSNNPKYKKSAYSKPKTVKYKKVEYINVCPRCGRKNGEGKGYCQAFARDCYCEHCAEFVEYGTCHYCSVPKKINGKLNKDFYKYNPATGEKYKLLRY